MKSYSASEEFSRQTSSPSKNYCSISSVRSSSEYSASSTCADLQFYDQVASGRQIKGDNSLPSDNYAFIPVVSQLADADCSSATNTNTTDLTKSSLDKAKATKAEEVNAINNNLLENQPPVPVKSMLAALDGMTVVDTAGMGTNITTNSSSPVGEISSALLKVRYYCS